MEEEIVSRSQKKRRVEELQKLGAALVALAPAQLDALTLPAELMAAVREAQRITSHGAKRRQLQFIGKLMRRVDAEPVRDALAQTAGLSTAARVQQKRLEQWRERLIGDDGALTEFASAHAGADLQALRALIRNARKEIAEHKPPRAQRELFRMIRNALEAA
ncbi:MAG: ribosome biogenesis factor YjgA [Burkholderiales bacterium]